MDNQSERFPDGLQREVLKSGFVRALINAIQRYIRDTFQIDPSRFGRRDRVFIDFELDDEEEQPKDEQIKADFVIMQDRPKKYYLTVVVKKENCDYAIKQSLACMCAAVRVNGDEENEDREPFYGFGSTGTHFNVIRLDSDGRYRLHKPLELMYGRMFNEGEKAKWTEECNTIIRVIYSIPCEKLRIPQVTVQKAVEPDVE